MAIKEVIFKAVKTLPRPVVRRAILTATTSKVTAVLQDSSPPKLQINYLRKKGSPLSRFRLSDKILTQPTTSKVNRAAARILPPLSTPSLKPTKAEPKATQKPSNIDSQPKTSSSSLLQLGAKTVMQMLKQPRLPDPRQDNTLHISIPPQYNTDKTSAVVEHSAPTESTALVPHEHSKKGIIFRGDNNESLFIANEKIKEILETLRLKGFLFSKAENNSTALVSQIPSLSYQEAMKLLTSLGIISDQNQAQSTVSSPPPPPTHIGSSSDDQQQPPIKIPLPNRTPLPPFSLGSDDQTQDIPIPPPTDSQPSPDPTPVFNILNPSPTHHLSDSTAETRSPTPSTPDLRISFEKLEEWRDFKVKLDDENFYIVSCKIGHDAKLKDIKNYTKDLLNGIIRSNPHALEKAVYIKPDDSKKTLVLEPQTKSSASFEISYEKFSSEYDTFKKTGIKKFEVSEEQEFYQTKYNKALQSAKQNAESLAQKAVLEKAVAITNKGNTCYLASFLQTYVLDDAKRKQLIEKLEEQMHRLNQQKARISREKLQLESRPRPWTADVDQEINRKTAVLEDIEKKSASHDKLAQFFRDLANKKAIENIDEFFRLLTEIRPERFVNEPYSAAQHSSLNQTRIGQQGDVAEVAAILNEYIYGNDSSPYTLTVETQLQDNSIRSRQESSISLAIPKDLHQEAGVAFNDLFEAYITGTPNQKQNSVAQIKVDHDFLTIDIKRLLGQTKYNGYIDIPGLNGQNSPDLFKNLELEAVVCHRGFSPKGGHYYALKKIEGQWVLLDDINGNHVLTEEQAKTFASYQAVQLLYRKTG